MLLKSGWKFLRGMGGGGLIKIFPRRKRGHNPHWQFLFIFLFSWVGFYSNNKKFWHLINQGIIYEKGHKIVVKKINEYFLLKSFF